MATGARNFTSFGGDVFQFIIACYKMLYICALSYMMTQESDPLTIDINRSYYNLQAQLDFESNLSVKDRRHNISHLWEYISSLKPISLLNFPIFILLPLSSHLSLAILLPSCLIPSITHLYTTPFFNSSCFLPPVFFPSRNSS